MIFKTVKNEILAVTLGIVLSSCTSVSSSADTQNPEEITQPETIATEELNGEILFQLLLAEIATNRREIGAAAALYSEIGRNYNDVNAIQRAIALNQTVKNYEQIYHLSNKWLELRPNAENALMANSLSAIATNRIDEGVASLNQWLTLNDQANTSVLLPSFSSLSAEHLTQVTSKLDQLQQNYPNNSALYYTRARLNFNAPDIAIALTNKAIKIDDNIEYKLYKFQLLQNLEQIEDAKSLIDTLSRKYPEDRQIGILYSRFIYQFEPKNLQKLEDLHTQYSAEPAIARTYARAAFKQEEFDSARAVYTHLLGLGFEDEANYFLGRLDLVNEMPDSASEHFKAVQQGPYLTSAIAEWVAMARKQDQETLLENIEYGKTSMPDQASTFWRLQASYLHLTGQQQQALSTYTKAIELFPRNIPLLYDQAMLASSDQNYTLLENNLSSIIELDPENINALNALGYTWADLNKNLTQAENYIDRALASNPNNPAFQDSMGWVQFRLGNLEEAFDWLNKAYSAMKNDEVAAHIAEVLWAMERTTEAENYLSEIKRLFPESAYIKYLEELFND